MKMGRELKRNIKQTHTINKHIPRRRGQCTSDAIKFSRNLYLASQSTGIREPKCHVEHVILVIFRFG